MTSTSVAEDENHHATTLREMTEEEARRIREEEMKCLRWTTEDLLQWAKGDPEKIRMAPIAH
ncbi:MAG: hypothetical protein H0X66_09035 [Verrucomicrobia bacterium]|nr:hypothetical protein [Verrucomicrobiota bacterium]